MNRWKAMFTENAEKDLVNLTKLIRQRIIERLDWLVKNFESITPIPLVGQYAGFYKLRVGNWRVIYEVDWDNNKIIVVIIGHRSEIYKI